MSQDVLGVFPTAGFAYVRDRSGERFMWRKHESTGFRSSYPGACPRATSCVLGSTRERVLQCCHNPRFRIVCLPPPAISCRLTSVPGRLDSQFRDRSRLHWERRERQTDGGRGNSNIEISVIYMCLAILIQLRT